MGSERLTPTQGLQLLSGGTEVPVASGSRAHMLTLSEDHLPAVTGPPEAFSGLL